MSALPTPAAIAASSSSPGPRLSIFRVLRLVLLGVGMFALGFILRGLIIAGESRSNLLSPLTTLNVTKKPDNPYAPYTFANLRELSLTPAPLTVQALTDSAPTHHTYLVSWLVPDLNGNAAQRVTGQMNIPTGQGPFPVIIMLRGYADRETYYTGQGTRNAAAAFARSGYITIAPDFLGYGGSDAESPDVLIARFAKPVTILQLLRNLEQLQLTLDAAAHPTRTTSAEIPPSVTATLFATDRLGVWAHSNGGQIALSVLEITSRNLPTTLWAPVSQPFPYSVYYYMDESADYGEYVRREISKFELELDNNPRDFSILAEPSRILAPVQIHQGGQDDAVPLKWSQTLATKLRAATVSAQLFTYPAADHNLVPDWDTAVQRDLQFFTRYLK